MNWDQPCHGGRESSSGALMRLFVVLEVFSRWQYYPTHVPGIHKVAADDNSICDLGSVLDKLPPLRLNIPYG